MENHMKLCIIADIHLPYHPDAPQYRAIDFALADAVKKNADLLVFAGDITADGNRDAANVFYEKVNNCGLPFLAVGGNSDLRSGGQVICPSQTVTEADGIKIFMLNDGDRTLTEAELSALSDADKNDLVFMHHPYRQRSERIPPPQPHKNPLLPDRQKWIFR